METKQVEEIKRLKTILEQIQFNCRTLRDDHTQLLNARVELQQLLKACLVDVRQQQDRLSKPHYALSKGRAGSKNDFDSKPKSRALLDSQDRVISTLYRSTFPMSIGSSELPAKSQSKSKFDDALRQKR
uniref:Uncharacterized protein n=1 Tax=Octactis speculum TaxID=3111310 RepID=A0A7S2GNU5_9STRA|mmetsp:Transcript_51584/g.70292  ORF Transcript_51584/g.70292 Transcript_51584/m.70292 type:complete len:129 (+) Transcript_51584:218-604(+)